MLCAVMVSLNHIWCIDTLQNRAEMPFESSMCEELNKFFLCDIIGAYFMRVSTHSCEKQREKTTKLR